MLMIQVLPIDDVILSKINKKSKNLYSNSKLVPLRSNIPINKLEEREYFVLPPRKNTLDGCVHGLQYSKMIVLPSYYQIKFNFPNETYKDLFKYILNHQNKIIMEHKNI